MGFGMARGFGWDRFGDFQYRGNHSARRLRWTGLTDRTAQQDVMRPEPRADRLSVSGDGGLEKDQWIEPRRCSKDANGWSGPENGWKTAERSEPKYMTKSGVRVRSKAEKIIADYFTDHGIWFIYEMPLKLAGLCLRPDFYLPDYDMIHEHFGLEEEGYRRAAQAKMSQYQRYGIGFSYTTAADETDIEQVLTAKLRKHGVRV